MNTYKIISNAWKERSNKLGDDTRSVMDQSFPQSINQVIHEIHLSEIFSVLPSGNIRCLDVGCGYGRLAEALFKKRSNMYINGIDIAPAFVKIFNQKIGKKGSAVVGDARKLPYRSASFDVVWMVVSLMYFLQEEDQIKVLKEIYRVLKPNGQFILIEPNVFGEFIVRWGGLLPKLRSMILQKKKAHTGGISFYPHGLSSLLKKTGFMPVSQRGYLLVTIFLTPLVILGKIIPEIAAWCLAAAWRADKLLPISSFSYIVTYVGRKDI